MLNKNNEKIELTETQQNPGAAKPEDFKVNEAIPFGGSNGDTLAEKKKMLKQREENRPVSARWNGTPDRPNVNDAKKPKTGSRLG
jgi:hypothetical protein